MKRILIVCDTFYPDKTSGAKLLYDLSNELKKNNKILVLSSCNSSFFGFFKKPKSIKKKNIEIIFIPSLYIKNKSLIIRGFFELFIGFILWYKTKKNILQFKPEALIVYSPSIFFGYLCAKIKKYFHLKSLCILRDLFPYWAIETGYIKNFILKIFFIKVFNRFLLNFDKIGLEAYKNIKILSKLNKINSKKFFYLPNWIFIKDFKFQKSRLNNKFTFLFGGNFGGGQDVKKVLSFYKKINTKFCKKFYLIGDGITASLIKNYLKKNLDNKIRYKKKMPQEKYLNFIKKTDFGIVSLNDKISSINFPGRIFSYLLNNKPIIILSSRRNELSKFIEKNKIGLRYSQNMNIDNFVKKMMKISNNLNRNNRYLYNLLEKKFSVKKVCEIITSII